MSITQQFKDYRQRNIDAQRPTQTAFALWAVLGPFAGFFGGVLWTQHVILSAL